MTFYRPPTNHGTVDTLGLLYRAVRAWRFYPQGHPNLRKAIEPAYKSLQMLLDGNTLFLSCGSTGFAFPDGESIRDVTKMSSSLAFELFIRRVQKITFFHDLFFEDLLELCNILTLSPDRIKESGGMDTIMAARGIRSIWVNEFDLNIIRGMRQKIEQSTIRPSGFEKTESGADFIPPETELPQQISNPDIELQLQALIARLAICLDDDTYLILARQAVVYADMLQLRHQTQLFLPLIELFASHLHDTSRTENMMQCSQFAIEQIVVNTDVMQRLFEKIGENNSISNLALREVLKAGGAPAIIAAIELIGRTTNLKTRKILSTELGNLNESAVPVLINMMQDSRWFIIRNICAILGRIGSTEALIPLSRALRHSDLRVRKEAIRSLALIGGLEAESAVIATLRSGDSSLLPQAIASLGGMRSQKSLPELMKILCAPDMFLKSLQLKIDAVVAISLIGECQVVPHLLLLLEERHLLATVRGRKLKCAVASCLGKLGDVRAIPDLEKLSLGNAELAIAAREAVTAIKNAKE